MTDPTSTVPLEEIDLSDHDAFVDEVPHHWFTTLRRESPVHWTDEDDGAGFWAVTRYEDIRHVHRHPEVFSSELGGTSLEDLEPEYIEARKSMLDMDPPRHDELRGMLGRRFTPRAVRVWEEKIRAVADEVIDLALEKDDEFEFVAEVSSEIPMQVFAEILGVPHEERRKVIDMGDRLLGNQDPEYATGEDDAHRHLPFSSPVALEMFEFGRKLAAERRKEPRDDIVTQLAHEPLTQQEYDVYFLLLATAGNETTRHTITHGTLALIENPDQMGRLRADRDLLKTAADEMLRWATPVYHFRRTAAEDTELAGTKISAGDKVTTWFVSGNRDESVFEDAHVFDLSRDPNPHVSFGPGGVHTCMGAHLAKLEVGIVFDVLLDRIEEIELTAPPERLRSNFFNGIKRMPVRVSKR